MSYKLTDLSPFLSNDAIQSIGCLSSISVIGCALSLSPLIDTNPDSII